MVSIKLVTDRRHSLISLSPANLYIHSPGQDLAQHRNVVWQFAEPFGAGILVVIWGYTFNLNEITASNHIVQPFTCSSHLRHDPRCLRVSDFSLSSYLSSFSDDAGHLLSFGACGDSAARQCSLYIQRQLYGPAASALDGWWRRVYPISVCGTGVQPHKNSQLHRCESGERTLRRYVRIRSY